jgi:hypothetical protein
VAASPVWRLFGREGIGTSDDPPVGKSVGDWVQYHVRAGKHDLLAEDWEHFARFALRKFAGLDRSAVAASPPAGRLAPAAAAEFRPVQAPLPLEPPAGAIVLFGDGSEGPPKFTAMSGGPIDWKVEDGALVVTKSKGHANHIHSTDVFRDADIHAEFGVEPPTDQDEGSLYRFAKPLVNASRPTGEWQVYDIRYTAPRRDAAGKVTTPGTITAWLNGKLVQDGIEFTEPRSPYIPYRHGVTDHLRAVKKRLDETGEGPLFLQDHGSPAKFRNVWIVPR